MAVAPAAEDPHRKDIYAWEDSWYEWNCNTCSLADCRRVIRKACARYGVPAPRVRQHPLTATYSIPLYGVVSLQSSGRTPERGGKNYPVALHEAAHIIVHHRHPRAQDHGPTFLGIYMWLLELNKIAPPVALHASARKHNLHWKIEAP